MKVPSDYQPSAEPGLVEKPILSVVNIYQDAFHGIRGKGLLEGLGRGLADDCELKIEMWSIDLLADPDVRELAAQDVAKAKVVVFSLCGDQPLPVTIQRWVESWPLRASHDCPALIALLNQADSGPRASPFVRGYLRGVASRQGMTFFALTMQADQNDGEHAHQSLEDLAALEMHQLEQAHLATQRAAGKWS